MEPYEGDLHKLIILVSRDHLYSDLTHLTHLLPKRRQTSRRQNIGRMSLTTRLMANQLTIRTIS